MDGSDGSGRGARRSCRFVGSVVAAAILLGSATGSRVAEATEADDVRPSAPAGLPVQGWFVEVNAGPSYAMYFPQDDGAPHEHFAASGSRYLVGVGHGWDLGPLRIDLGLRAQVQHVEAVGRYDGDVADPTFRSNYTFVAPQVQVAIASSADGPVDGTLGMSLGTAALLSDRLGERIEVQPIPVYGSFEAGLLFELAPWLEGRALLAWQPPVEGLHILTPELGARARF
jgi:hypothetical protein